MEKRYVLTLVIILIVTGCCNCNATTEELQHEIKNLQQMVHRSLTDIGQVLETVKVLQNDLEAIKGNPQTTAIGNFKGECLTGYTKVGNSCYMMIDDNNLKSWSDAYTFCKTDWGRHLLVLETKQELDDLQTFLQISKQWHQGNPDVWVNAEKAHDGNFYWEVCQCESGVAQGQSCQYSLPVSQDMWREGLPDNYGGNEVFLELDIQCDSMLNDNAHVLQRFVCEYEL